MVLICDFATLLGKDGFCELACMLLYISEEVGVGCEGRC